MIIVSVLVLLLGVVGVGLILVGLPGPRVSDLKSCPKCGYDQTGTLESGCCPERGFDWKSKGGLMHQPMRTRQVVVGVILIVLVVLSGYWFSLFDRDDWSADLPRFILHPLARMIAPPPTVPPGKLLPHPDDALYGSRHHWDRTLWRTQAARSFDALLGRAERSGDDLASLEALVPAMQEAQVIFGRHAGMFWSSVDPVDRWLIENRTRLDRLDTDRSWPMGTWVRSELQIMSTVMMPESTDRFVRPPVEIFEALRHSKDADVRRYAFDQLSWAWQGGDDAAWEVMVMMDAAEAGSRHDAHFAAVVDTYRDEARRRLSGNDE